MKRSICLYFKIHQPFQLKSYQLKDVDVCHSYEDAEADQVAINKLSDSCYLPVNEIILKNIMESGGGFKVSYSISGAALELLAAHRPEVIASFQKLVDTGAVELLAETYYNSLSFLHSKTEFIRQVEKHSALVKKLFAIEPKVFRNTELIHNNKLVALTRDLGFNGVLCEGIERVLKGRTPNRLYAAPQSGDLPLFLRNARLSDDIAFRFDDENWSEHPLTARKFTDWLEAHPAEDEVINLFMDYETFGIHKNESSGILEFLQALPGEIFSCHHLEFSTPSEVIESRYPHDLYDVPETISWNDQPEACCVWSQNTQQNNMLKKIYSLEHLVMSCGDQEVIDLWGRLQTADYFFYMADTSCTAGRHPHTSYSSQQTSGYYSNILTDLEIRLIRDELRKRKLHFIPQTHNLY